MYIINRFQIPISRKKKTLFQFHVKRIKKNKFLPYLLQGMTVGDAKRRVKLTIENTINALQGIYSLTQTRSESGSNSIWIRIRFVLD